MNHTNFRVTVEKDHLRKLASAKPIPALSELVWNAVDADATRIDIEVAADKFSTKSIIIKDDGHGIDYENAEALFGKLGGSWKTHGRRSKNKGRILHGKEGKGRFKALALGRVVDWDIRYAKDHKIFNYKITIIRDDISEVRVTAPVQVDSISGTGTSVTVSEIDQHFRSLEKDSAIQALAEVFALYLHNYRDVKIYMNHTRIDPASFIANQKKFKLSSIDEAGLLYNCDLELIEWKSASERWFFSLRTGRVPLREIITAFSYARPSIFRLSQIELHFTPSRERHTEPY